MMMSYCGLWGIASNYYIFEDGAALRKAVFTFLVSNFKK
jgi:hypothetical protein